MRSLCSLALLIWSASVSLATSTVTFTGTINSSNVSGYEVNDPFSVTFTLADYASVGDPTSLNNEDSEYDWSQSDTSTAPVYGDIKFTGSGGAFENPANPFMMLHIIKWEETKTLFTLVAEVSSGEASEMGITAGGDYVKSINIEFVADDLFENLGVIEWNPEDFFSTVYGTYAGSQGFTQFLLGNGEEFNLNLTEMTIAAVPEPSSIALAMLAGGALVLVARRKRLTNLG